MRGPIIQTVLSEIKPNTLGFTLPHEHIFTDLRGPHVYGYAQADPNKVINTLKPYLDEITSFGVTGMVECSTIGVGRNPKILKRIALISGLNIIAPTGVYREAFVPDYLKDISVKELTQIWVNDITNGMEGTIIKAGFIKMAVSDEGITDLEAKNLKAAVWTSHQTGAVIASHTIGGKLAFEEMDLLQSYGLDLNRFIWTHAQSESDPNYHLKAAQRGAFVSIDAIGSGWVSDENMLEYTLRLIKAGFTHRILLSHDAGWFDPSQPDGQPSESGIRGYSSLFKDFLPKLKSFGITTEDIYTITIKNPATAFAL